jgi:hypothetical protein
LTARLVTPPLGFLRSTTITTVIMTRKITVGSHARIRFPSPDRRIGRSSWP